MRQMTDEDQKRIAAATAAAEEDEKSKEDQQDKVKRMKEHLYLLREKRITLQKEMAKMETFIRQKRQANS